MTLKPEKLVPEPKPNVVRPPNSPEAPAPDVEPDVVVPRGPEVTTPSQPREIPPSPGGWG